MADCTTAKSSEQKLPDKTTFEATNLTINWVVETIESTGLGEKRPFAVVLPESYRENDKQRYPVMYVLDGG